MARTLKKEGILFKAVYVDYEKKPLPSRSSSGRFHDAESGQHTTYLTDSKDTAWKEVSFRWKADRKSYRMVEVRVKLKKVLDLTESRMQDKYEVNQKMLVADDYHLTQRVAARLKSEGIEAFWTYSRADQPEGRTLVVFLDNLGPDSRVEINRITSVPE